MVLLLLDYYEFIKIEGIKLKIMSFNKQEIENSLLAANNAFLLSRNYPISKRVAFMRTVADEIESLDKTLIETAMAESNLPEGRLIGEKGRTIFQWRSYADALERGDSLHASIDTANAERTPPKPDLRKTNVPLGPVAVFGASNFPFAFSTAGGDTASAIAAGCSVVVKAHPGHPETSTIMANAIIRAAEKAGMPAGIFSHVLSSSYEAGQMIVTHPIIKAVGFTGSLRGGEALVALGNSRPEPIPVFAEMGSINPIFFLPEQLKIAASDTAKAYVGSLTLGVGQFCTNPGLAIAIDNPALDIFIESLIEAVKITAPATMLNEGIAKSYFQNREHVSSQEGVQVLATSELAAAEGQGIPTLATVTAHEFLANKNLQDEVFGPFALLVKCKDTAEMESVAAHLHGQITASIIGTDADLLSNPDLVSLIQLKCGRLLFNNYPTGVEVVKSMHHGGPYPAASDSRYTSVGSDSILRFTRPFSFQNWPDSLLPDELKNSNPLNIWRSVNNELTKDAI